MGNVIALPIFSFPKITQNEIVNLLQQTYILLTKRFVYGKINIYIYVDHPI